MKNKKTVFGILIAFVILISIIVYLVFPKNMGPIEPFLNLGDLFAGGDGNAPGKPAYYQIGMDCTTGNLVTPGELIQPDIECDDWEINRFERPFNATSQDEYYPDLDIQHTYLGRDADWYYLRFALFDPQPGTNFLAGTYAMEMDLDGDDRGDLLVLVSEPGKENGDKWSSQGVQIWADSNDDVGGLKPNIPEGAVVADGYDILLFDQGIGVNPNSAWARVFMTGSAYVELAFKTDYLEGDIAFKWWVWSWYGEYSPESFKLHDFYSHEQAGDIIEGMDFFPIKEIYAIDSSCANMWGAFPDPTDEDFCDNLNKPDIGLLLKCCIPFLSCVPGVPPGDDPCFLPIEEWFILIWQPAHPGETVPDDIWIEYLKYFKDPYCPPEGSVTPIFTPRELPPPDEDTPPTRETLTPIPEDLPPPPPPEVPCTSSYNKKKCEEAGGTMVDGGVDARGNPLPKICKCP